MEPWKELAGRIIEKQRIQKRAAPARPTYWLLGQLQQHYPNHGTAAAANAAYTCGQISYPEFMAVRDKLWRYATVTDDGDLRQPHTLRLSRRD